MEKKYNWIIWVVLAFVAMNFIPGEGTKAADQQAIVSTQYSCATAADCPVCVMSGIAEANTTGLGQFSYSACTGGKCQLTEYCVVWDCPPSASSNCQSVKRTLLDNTLGKLNQNPWYLVIAIGLIAALVMLK